MKPAPRRWQVSDAAPLTGQPPLLGRILAARGHDVASALATGVRVASTVVGRASHHRYPTRRELLSL